jgi:uncharacterized protein with LGFP repeats
MATIQDAQQAAYQLANPNVAFNPNAAICKRWLAEKAKGNLLGVPIGPEIDAGGGKRAQAFTSGAVIVWNGGDSTDIV